MYVYGVVRAESRPKLPRRGVDGRPVGRVCTDELAALVGDAPDGDVRASRRNIMAHSQVLQEVVRSSCDVLPMRFGVVMPDAAAVREELLAAHADALLAQLEALHDLVELDVTVTCPEEALLRAIMEDDPRLAEASRRLRESPGEATYYQRIELGERVAAQLTARRDDAARRLLDGLGPLAKDAAVSEPRHEDMLAGVAFLVPRARVAKFDLEVERLAEGLLDEARVRCVGPLPPYHFAEGALGQESGAWA